MQEHDLYLNRFLRNLDDYHWKRKKRKKMAKKERLEDLGKLSIMLKNIVDNNLFLYASKHGYEEWKRFNHDKLEYFESNGLGSGYGEPRGLESIFEDICRLHNELQECLSIAYGDEDE